MPLGRAGMACGDCLQQPPAWRLATAPLRYDFPVDRLVQALKYRRDLAAGSALAAAMLRGPLPDVPRELTPWLVPVPLHWTRALWRGFNQATELALLLARATGWPLRHRWLRRRRRTPPQSALALADRQHNLDGAFRWHGPALDGRTIVLVDDVLTSGATAGACARALTGAASVDLWVAARALG